MSFLRGRTIHPNPINFRFRAVLPKDGRPSASRWAVLVVFAVRLPDAGGRRSLLLIIHALPVDVELSAGALDLRPFVLRQGRSGRADVNST